MARGFQSAFPGYGFRLLCREGSYSRMMMTWTYFLHAEKRVRSQFKPETVHRGGKEQADMKTLLNSMSR